MKTSKQNRVIKLLPLSEINLSSQLIKYTGDNYNSIDFKNLRNEGLNADAGNIIIHKKTGLIFQMPDCEHELKIVLTSPSKFTGDEEQPIFGMQCEKCSALLHIDSKKSELRKIYNL